MASVRKRGKVWYYRFVDGSGVKRSVKGCPDKRATEEMTREAESEAARVRAGLVDPRELALREHAERPLVEHLADWRADMINRGFTTGHAELTEGRVRRLVAVMFGVRIEDIDGQVMTRERMKEARRLMSRSISRAKLAHLTETDVQAGMARIRDAGYALQTCNMYRSAARAFSRWAWRKGRLRYDPLIGVTRYNAGEDRRHDRRTLGLDEMRRVIEAARNGKPYRKMTGPARAICYRLAASTGLRYSEIASIKTESFDFASAPATVTVLAAFTKNGERATLSLPADVADDLRRHTAALAPGTAAFDLPDKGSAMLRVDLEAAGIPYCDSSGLFFDFHALRCQMATMLDAAGVSPRVIQKKMRHSTLELTGRYTRPRLVDLDSATAMLPSLKTEDIPESSAMAATGTDAPLGHRRGRFGSEAVGFWRDDGPWRDRGQGGFRPIKQRKKRPLTARGVKGRKYTRQDSNL